MKYRIKADGNGRFYAEVKGWIFWHRISNNDGYFSSDTFGSQAHAKEAIANHKETVEYEKARLKREVIDEGEI